MRCSPTAICMRPSAGFSGSVGAATNGRPASHTFLASSIRQKANFPLEVNQATRILGRAMMRLNFLSWSEGEKSLPKFAPILAIALAYDSDPYYLPEFGARDP